MGVKSHVNEILWAFFDDLILLVNGYKNIRTT